MLNKIVSQDADERTAILQSVGLNSDEPLRIAVEAMIAQAYKERPTHPAWYPLSARNAEGIAAVREVLEAQGRWGRKVTPNHLEGVQHLESGRFLAVHNTCERTGLDKGLPRFASARSRSATKSLRDDLQGDFCQLFDDFAAASSAISPEHDLTLHLCVFIERESSDTGEVVVTARAELVIGAVCSDLGIIGCRYRLPIDVSGIAGTERAMPDSEPGDEGPVEAEISIRRKS